MTLDYNGGFAGHIFDGPLIWTGDGKGARLEFEMNLWEWPEVTPGKWALYGRESLDSESASEWYLENVTDCTDEYDDGTGGDDDCPGTMNSDQNTGSADGYCDDFDDWGSCQPVYNKQQVATSSERLMEKHIFFRTEGMTSATNWMGAKCVGSEITENNLEWCNDPISMITVPPGYEARIDTITLRLMQGAITTTGGNEISDCTIFLNVSNAAWSSTNDGGCNDPGRSAACDAAITGYPLAHLGYTAAISPDTWPRLNTEGEIARFENIDLTARSYWRLQVDHRHECNAASDNDGDACWNNADCPSGSCVLGSTSVESIHNGEAPFECIKVPPISANVIYTLRKVETY
jgi:hypothetical protein